MYFGEVYEVFAAPFLLIPLLKLVYRGKCKDVSHSDI
jgi:hypothetical protein